MVPQTEPCALRSTQPLKVSTTDSSWGKGGRCFWLTTYHPCSAETSIKSGGLNLPGTPWATSACCGRPFLLDVLISQIYFGMKLYMFRTVFLSIIRSLYSVHCSSTLVLLESCLQTCMILVYTIAECTMNKLLMMDRRTVRNM